MTPLWVQLWSFHNSSFYCLASSGLWVCAQGLLWLALSLGPVVSGPSKLHSSRCFGFGLNAPHTPMRGPSGQVERKLELLLQENSPKCPRGSFSFWKNPPAQSCHSIQGRAYPLTQLTSPARPGIVWSGPHMAQLSILPSWPPQSPWVYHFILIPLPVTSSNQVCLGAAQALFGRGGSH